MSTFQSFRLKTVAGLAAAAMLVTSGAAFAGQNQTNFTVTASVNQTCAITVANLAFGVYNPQVVSTGNSQVQITCNASYPDNAIPTVVLNYGSNSNSAWYMKNPNAQNNQYLNYLLCEDAACNTQWPTTGAGATLPNVNGTGTQWTGLIYGQIPALQVVSTGNYTDTVQATVNF